MPGHKRWEKTASIQAPPRLRASIGRRSPHAALGLQPLGLGRRAAVLPPMPPLPRSLRKIQKHPVHSSVRLAHTRQRAARSCTGVGCRRSGDAVAAGRLGVERRARRPSPARDRAVRARPGEARFVRRVHSLGATSRAELTDRMLIFSERHLRVVLADYVRHYNGRRPHRSCELRPPQPAHPVADLSFERIRCRPVLGGLINEYERAA